MASERLGGHAYPVSGGLACAIVPYNEAPCHPKPVVQRQHEGYVPSRRGLRPSPGPSRHWGTTMTQDDQTAPGDRTDEEHISERRLRRVAGPVLLWGLGVGSVISGEFFGWNFGMNAGGWGWPADRHGHHGPADPANDLPKGMLLAMGSLVVFSMISLFIAPGAAGADTLATSGNPLPQAAQEVYG